MVIRKSVRGPFLACSGYPKCRNTKSLKSLEKGTGTTKTVKTQTKKGGKTSAKTTTKTKLANSKKSAAKTGNKNNME
jgi:ssDNA-binding Zn-finger/Zn-ribbon topoisomerase 1